MRFKRKLDVIVSKLEDEYVVMKERANMNPGDLDKFTIVIWIEGDDPDCLDPLIGGEMKMTMHITEEHNAPQ